MKAQKLFSVFSVPVACVLAVFVIGVAGCGSGSDDESPTTGETAETTGSAEGNGNGEPEPGDDHGGNAPAPSGDAVRSEKVEIDNFAYKPDPVRIEEGGKVIWQNEDSVAHTATAEDGSFDTGPIDEGKIKSETFKEAGTYRYVCSIHPQMHGTIEVVPAG